MEALHHGVTF